MEDPFAHQSFISWCPVGPLFRTALFLICASFLTPSSPRVIHNPSTRGDDGRSRLDTLWHGSFLAL